VGGSVRIIAASILPALVMILLRFSHLITPPYEVYGWLVAALWFVASIGSWIDPNLGDRLKIVSTFRGTFGGSEDS
jgi:hypothetical protein